MKNDELIKLRELINNEVARRKRVTELLKNDLVREYLEINNITPNELDSNNIEEIINQILKTYKITETNGIYVCVSSYFMDSHLYYNDSEVYAHELPISSKRADYRIYQDIETMNRFQAAKRQNNPYLIKNDMNEFEKAHVVLNPYNTSNNQNGYNEVRMNFFENALQYGQEESKKILLKKYPRL